MSQQIQLRQNSHLTDLLSILKNFQSSDIMVDVTLSCEGHNIKAHKLILSACSPYFESLFTENPCQHPIVIMNGMKFEVLHAVMDFIYKGDVYIARDTLPEFFKAAKTLQVKGLETFSNTQHPIKTTQHPIKTTQNTEPQVVNEQHFQRSPTPVKKRKRSLSDSAKSDEDIVVKEEPMSPEVVVKEEPLSPEIHDLSGDEYFSMPRMKLGDSSLNSHVPKMNPFFSQQSTQYIVREPESDEEEYESSSELLRQTLTTKNVVSKNDIGFTSSDNIRTDKKIKITSDTDSSNMQGRSESPLDEKPIIQFQDSPEISPERAMALYDEQSFHQPGPSNYKDGSLIQQKSSQAQDFGNYEEMREHVPVEILPFLKQRPELTIFETKLHPTTSKSSSLYHCDICPFETSSPGNLQSHMESHKSLKGHECQLCGKLFKTPKNLQAHMQTHEPGQPFTCMYCEKKFKHNSSLKTHIKTHFNFDVSCPLCEKTFSNNTAMKKHLVVCRQMDDCRK